VPQQQVCGLLRGRGARELGGEGEDLLAQPGQCRRWIDDAQAGRDERRLLHVDVLLVPVERPLPVRLVRGQEAVDLRVVHPQQQVRIVGLVGLPLRRDAPNEVVGVTDLRDGMLGVVDRAHRRVGDEARDRLQPAPGI